MRDGVPRSERGRRIVVNANGQETFDLHEAPADTETNTDDL